MELLEDGGSNFAAAAVVVSGLLITYDLILLLWYLILQLKEMLLAIFEELDVKPSDKLVEAILEKVHTESKIFKTYQ